MKLEDILDFKALFLTMVILVAYKYMTKEENETVIVVPNK